MHLTIAPGLDSSLQTDDEDLMEISEIDEGLETKSFVTDSAQVFTRVHNNNYLLHRGARSCPEISLGGIYMKLADEVAKYSSSLSLPILFVC